MAARAAPCLVARLELAATAAVPGGRLRYMVINTGTVPIMLGEAYGLERLTDSGWEDVALPYAFRLWGRRLELGGQHELDARIPEHAQPGRHRLRKRLLADRDPHPGYDWIAAQEIQPIEVSAGFEVRLSQGPVPRCSG